MRLPTVTNRVPDLDKFFSEDRNYLGFSNVDEAVIKVKLLLEDQPYANLIAEHGYMKVHEAHTWDARINQILETIK